MEVAGDVFVHVARHLQPRFQVIYQALRRSKFTVTLGQLSLRLVELQPESIDFIRFCRALSALSPKLAPQRKNGVGFLFGRAR